MKFAKTLEDVMIPEWQTKYVEYKVGKKRINATTINLRNASSSPAINALRASRVIGDPRIGTRGRRLSQILAGSPHLPSRWSNTVCSNLDHVESDTTAIPGSPTTSARSPLQPALSGPPQQQGGKRASYPQAGKRLSFRNSGFLLGFLNTHENENQPPQSQIWKRASYGSSGFWQGMSQDHQDDDEPSQPTKPPSLVLPDPIRPVGSPDVYEGEAIALGPSSYSVKSMPTANLQNQLNLSNPRPLLKRFFTLRKASAAPPQKRAATIEEVQAEAEKEFLKWLLGELKKCEEFYQIRENEASKRFDEMREQLDIMRDRWFKAKHNIPFEEDDTEDITDTEMSSSGYDGYPVSSIDSGGGSKKRVGWKSFTEAVNGLTRPRPTTAQVYTGVITAPEGTRDYVRRPPARKPLNNPAHRFAKRRLKRAYIEYYHGLEMLKSYVTVNRECFRKITKKFDKASGLRTSHRFMTEYVDKSRFGGTDNELDDLLNDTEALFARFFERGNRKEASARLRSKESKALYYGSVSRSWFYIGTAFVIGLYGLQNTLIKSHDHTSPDEALRSSYLLQIWGGVALLLLQVLLFTFNLRVWKNNKINYAFIFEFDPHNQLNYRQFLEFPAIVSLIWAICFWFSSYDFWGGRMDKIYWPAIFTGVVGGLLLIPFRTGYYHSRKWIVKTMWRLVLSGAYPVEFRDFWIGDMLCSHTYAMGNVALFFCLYSNSWRSPSQCNSNHSRLMGFMSTVPALWRLFQCIRRYYNSKMWFPHLVNGGKYAFTVLHYMMLSIWQHNTDYQAAKAAFIAVASINSIYVTVWDIAMDWSLLDPYAKHPFLRKDLGYKKVWPYYLAMFLDPLLRCDWFFYVIYAGQTQHSATLPFLLACGEVLRRFMWSFFRMENEHVGNVGANRAFRDIPLPYHLPRDIQLPIREEQVNSAGMATEPDLERMDTSRHRRISRRDTSGLPIVRTINRVGRTMNQAHLQDYERRRSRVEEVEMSESEDEEEEEEEEGDDYYERTRETEGRGTRRSSMVNPRNSMAGRSSISENLV